MATNICVSHGCLDCSRICLCPNEKNIGYSWLGISNVLCVSWLCSQSLARMKGASFSSLLTTNLTAVSSTGPCRESRGDGLFRTEIPLTNGLLLVAGASSWHLRDISSVSPVVLLVLLFSFSLDDSVCVDCLKNRALGFSSHHPTGPFFP